MTTVSKSGLTPQQLATLKRTIAKDLNDLEFDLFMEACRSYQLDPFRRQIIPAIYHKRDADKRSMTLITTRDGLRVIASRQGNYRPASDPAEFLMKPGDWQHPGEGLPPNPLKIEACTVRLWRKDGNEWFPVVGQAYWDEYAPRGGAWSRSQWPTMPRVMIQKCAEAAALRAGWPDAFAGLYVAEEMAQAGGDDLTASQMLAKAEQERRQRLIGHGITFDMDGTKLEAIPAGQVFDRVSEALRDMSDDDVLRWRQRNELGLREFWAASPSDALELKEIIEPRCEAAMTKGPNDG
jgi:phage recombination protein Bet